MTDRFARRSPLTDKPTTTPGAPDMLAVFSGAAGSHPTFTGASLAGWEAVNAYVSALIARAEVAETKLFKANARAERAELAQKLAEQSAETAVARASAAERDKEQCAVVISEQQMLNAKRCEALFALVETYEAQPRNPNAWPDLHIAYNMARAALAAAERGSTK